ncbi:segregation and condensation protein A [Williamsoniiplasma luminosum]|uniref:Segregation and condensation protein A n=1 Tax=Williamsoniiplasma luminosum TaxID=214888 RepID=A0A2K8NW93_9MOLU|nr:segregation/condensation protein A [Williamsoniiplasma luminosum]ATZ17468.1 segregation and condensation protein A [Williamsoniiplasma luminosum]
MKHWDEIKIGNFLGPLDLLLTMVREKKINIMDVNLIELADQYIMYIQKQQSLDIEIASEYLTMAAQLIEMKSQLLLPKEVDFLEENNLYDDFLQQLTQYEQIRSVTDFFVKKQEDYYLSFSKTKSKNKFSSTKNLEANIDETLIEPLTIDMDAFAQIFKNAMARSTIQDEDFSELEEEYFNTITTDVISPHEITQMILRVMKTDQMRRWRLEELITKDILNLKNLISTFLAVLDIVRNQVAIIEQSDQTLFIEFSAAALKDQTLVEQLENRNYDEQE